MKYLLVLALADIVSSAITLSSGLNCLKDKCENDFTKTGCVAKCFNVEKPPYNISGTTNLCVRVCDEVDTETISRNACKASCINNAFTLAGGSAILNENGEVDDVNAKASKKREKKKRQESRSTSLSISPVPIMATTTAVLDQENRTSTATGTDTHSTNITATDITQDVNITNTKTTSSVAASTSNDSSSSNTGNTETTSLSSATAVEMYKFAMFSLIGFLLYHNII
ncbi:hypothetical protein AX774_g2557 [Zancudomyces culisetae]|uniref:Uncharacterized protein n=1 Tax=Zancudomyces culisetae TaxID=1213189 RepID=A0A1R1PSG9_ZANCU|nr:hypothetical protein AX774_g2557 [Zancudomyces culisetae]|eukprot:OMH83936.1 hypothetical protein AX774_g2557 [Zancudomyces culisetae]